MVISEHPRLDFQIFRFWSKLYPLALENTDFQKSLDIIGLAGKTSKIDNVGTEISKSTDWIFSILPEMKVHTYP